MKPPALNLFYWIYFMKEVILKNIKFDICQAGFHLCILPFHGRYFIQHINCSEPLATKREQARQDAGRTGVLPSCSPIMFKLDCSLSLSTIYLHSTRKKFYILINVISPPFLTHRNAAVDCVFVFTRAHSV